MTQMDTLRELARRDTRHTLSQSAGFRSLDPADQRDLYRRQYAQRLDELSAQAGLSTATGEGVSRALAPAPRGVDRASDRIDDDRHRNERIDQAGDLAGDFIDNVDFPGFVRDLLKGVFDANLEVTITQMQTYQELLKTATASVSKFVNAIDDTAAFGYLAENQSDDFSFDFGGEPDEDGEATARLTDASGEPVDLGNNEVKAKIMEAKIAMAQEQRKLLRETILMGVSRLVVEKGQVKASVLFDIKASEQVNKADKAAVKKQHSKSTNARGSTGFIGKIFGGGGGGHTTTDRKTEISVSSAKSTANTELQAKLAGSVDITFKSDYFELDRFADIMEIEARGAAGMPAPSAEAQPPAAG
jgi:hypothetical protein